MCQGFWSSAKKTHPSYRCSMKYRFKTIAIVAIPIKRAYTVLTTFDFVRRIQNTSQMIHTTQERRASQVLEKTIERKNITLTTFMPFSEHIASTTFGTAFIPFSDHSILLMFRFCAGRRSIKGITCNPMIIGGDAPFRNNFIDEPAVFQLYPEIGSIAR